MIKIAELKAALMKRHLDNEPSSNIKIVIKIHYMHPGPIGRGMSSL